MKKLFAIFAFVPMLFGCSLQNDNSEKNIALVEKYIQSVENLDYQTMESLLDDSYYGYGPSYGDSIGKAQAIVNWKHNVETLYKSIKYTKSRNAAVTIKTGENRGEWVSNWGELHIVYKNGKHVTLWANTTYKLKNGKIIKSYTFYNEADALKQMGYVLYNTNDL